MLKKNTLLLIVLCSAFLQNINAQSLVNCIPFYQNNFYDTYITNVTIGTINNSHATTAGSPDYTYFNNMILDANKGQTFTLSVSTEAIGAQSGVRAFVDFNGNGNFEGNETFNLGEAGITSSVQITIPANAANGLIRLRVAANEQAQPTACDNATYGEAEDYQIAVCDGTAMSFLSANGVATSTAIVRQGQTDQQVLSFNYITQGCANPYSINSIDFSTGLSNDNTDIASAKLFYSIQNNFASASQVGFVLSNPGTNFSITNIQNGLPMLRNGNNYFWLVYDLSAAATNANIIDAEVLAVNTTEGGGSVDVPTNPNPTGVREIIYQQCIPTVAAAATGDDFELNSYSVANFNSRAAADGFNSTSARGYNNYSLSDSLQLCAGTSYPFTANTTNSSTAFQGVLHFWADWNQDGDFDDELENQIIGTTGLATGAILIITATNDFASEINVPEFAKNGLTVARVGLSQRARNQTCGNFPIGEFDDILIRVNSLESNTSVLEYREDTLAFDIQSNSNQTGYVWQQSTDLISYTDIVGSMNAGNLSVTASNTVNAYRISKDVASCPADVNGEQAAFSGITEVLKVGLDSLLANPIQVCQGDSADLSAFYNFKSQIFTNPAAANIIDQGEIYAGALAVTSANPVSGYNLNAVCVDITTSLITDLSFEIIAPNGKKVLLNDGSSANAANTNYSFCLKQDSTLSNIKDETAALQGDYLSEQSFSNLTGANATGNWTLRILSSNANVDATLNSWSLKFGYNDSVSWTNALDFANPNLDVAKTQVNTTQFFTANLQQSLNTVGSFKDSIEVIARTPGSTQITDIVSNDGDLLFCQGADKHLKALLNTPIVGDNYIWYVNDVAVPGEVRDSIITNTLNDGDEVKVEFILNDICGSVYSVDSVIVNERILISPNVDLTPSIIFPICNGSDFTLNASYLDTNETSQFSWELNGNEIAQKVDSFFFAGLSTGDEIVVNVTNAACGMELTAADTFVYNISPSIDLQAEITNFKSDFCLGDVFLSYDTTGNNTNGTFNWELNGVSISNESSVTLDSLELGVYNFTVSFTPNSGCFNQSFISTTNTINVLSIGAPSLDILAQNYALCPNKGTVIKAVNIVNGGDAPKFQWYQNGNILPFQTKDSLIIFSQNSDKNYSLTMVSDYECSSIDTVFSNTVDVTVTQNAMVELGIINNSPINACIGDSLNLVANYRRVTGNFDFSKAQYKWLANGAVVGTDSTLNIARTLGTSIINLRVVYPSNCSGLDSVLSLQDFRFNTFTTPDSTFTVSLVAGKYTATANAFPNPNTNFKWFLNGVLFSTSPQTDVFFKDANINLCLEIDNGNTCFAYSCQTFSFVGVNNNTVSNESLNVYPNPTQGLLNITWDNIGINDFNVEVLNIQGQVVLKAENLSNGIDVSQLSKGTYIVKATSQNNYAISKFQKQ